LVFYSSVTTMMHGPINIRFTTNFTVSHKCGDMFRHMLSSSDQFLNLIRGTSSKGAHFCDPKMFKTLRQMWTKMKLLLL